MKITQIMFSSGWGGAERHVVELCQALQSDGIGVQLICRPEFVWKQRHRLTNLHCVDTINVSNNWDYLSLLPLQRAIRSFLPDVIHTHLARATWIGGMSARMAGIPALSTTHNRIKPKYLRFTRHFISTTRAQRQHLRNLHIAGDKIRVIPNFSMLPAVNTVRIPNTESPVFVAMGRFVHKKGFDVLIDAFAEVVRHKPSATLILGGDGELKNALLSRVSMLGLSEHIQFCGWVENIAAFLDRNAAFVLPSRDEPFGIVVLEAMACGLPIITSKTSGPLEILDDASAWFADIADSRSLADAMLSCSNKPEEAEARALRARDRYATHYQVNQTVPEIRNYYRELSHCH